MCDEKDLSLRGWVHSSSSLEALFPPECPQELPLVYQINDWYLYDNDDSFDDDRDDANQTLVVLISHVQHDWTKEDDFAEFVSLSHFDWSVDGDADDSGTTSEQGFYDVTMLSGGVIGDSQPSSSPADNDIETPALHPDLQLECILATHHRQRRVADLLLASDNQPQSTAAAVAIAISDLDEDADESDEHGKLSREPSFTSIGPQSSKVRPDDFWIREEAEAVPSDSEDAKCASQPCSCETVSTCSCESSVKLQQSSAASSLQSSPISLCSPARKVLDIALQLAHDEHGSERLSETGRHLSIYETEGISFEPGLVRRTVDHGVDVSASSGVKTASLSRPVSIYETEEISLEPGLVRRTRQEIEQR